MKITFALIPTNFARGRKGQRIEAIVVHIMEGTLSGTDSWFRNPSSNVSAHYGVSRTGTVVQWVDDRDTAWHAGRVLRPTAPIWEAKKPINPNLWTIGIELEGFAKDEPTKEQMQATAELVRTLSRRHGVALDRRHVIGHREIFAGKTCPGRVDVDTLVELAAGVPAIPTIEPELDVPIRPVRRPKLRLDKIDVPTREHVEALVRELGFSADDVRQGFAVAKELFSAVAAGNGGGRREVALEAVDAIADWLKGKAA